jgi:hypothetical protein
VGRVDELSARRNLLFVALIHAVHSAASLICGCRLTHLLFLRTALATAFGVHLEQRGPVGADGLPEAFGVSRLFTKRKKHD